MTHPRLSDPGEHFPYKRDVALAALAAEPDPDSNNHPESRYTSARIIEASAAYVAAQAAHLTDPTDETATEYESAKQALLAARAEHRKDRGVAFAVTAEKQEG